jgi:phage-related protein
MTDSVKGVVWIGSSRKELSAFPGEVKEVLGYGIYLAQTGGRHPDAKPMKGFGGAGVLEIIDDFDGDTYRGVYTIKFGGFVYVLHAFQKKSKRGAATPQVDIELIKARLNDAESDYRRRKEETG